MDMIHPIKMDNKENLVLFVHGLFGGMETWVNVKEKQPAKFVQFLLENKEIKDSFDFAIFHYHTKLFNTPRNIKWYWNFLIGNKGKNPKNLPIEKIAELLNTQISISLIDKYEKIVLVGHSMGGLIIKSYILNSIEKQNFNNKIALFISLAVPHRGANLAILGEKFSNNRQIEDLKPLANNIAELNDNWIRHSNKLPKAIYFYGIPDEVVDETSRPIEDKDREKEYELIPTNDTHFSIVHPENNKDVVIKRIKDALLGISKKIPKADNQKWDTSLSHTGYNIEKKDKTKRLKISIVSSHEENENDFRIKNLFQSLIDELKSNFPEFPYYKADFINFTFNSEIEQIEQDSIVSINPVKYILCKKELGDKIIPIAAIKKIYQDTPYFPSFFIAHKNSEIDSIRSDEIKTLYAVSENSTSGFIAPIFKLWESGIIESPNEKGIQKKGWDLKFVGSHRDVEQRVLDDKYAIGATGQFTNQNNPKYALVKILLRYYYLPQDVLIISKNLKPYKEFIESWFYKLFENNSEWIDVFFDSSSRITGLYPINEEFQNALKELELMTDYVHNFKYDKDRIISSEISGNRNLLISNNLRKMLSENKIQEVIDTLSEHFTILSNDKALRDITMYSSNYSRIVEQENLGVENYETLAIEKNKLNRSLLHLIDGELNKI